MDSIARAARALHSLGATPPSEPLAPVILRARAALGAPVDRPALFAYWRGRDPGSITSSMRYRWDLSHKRCVLPSYAGAPETWRAWRPLEQPLLEKDPFEFEERLTVPILIAECAELLLESEGEDAKELFAEAEPVFRRDLAFYIQAAHAWADTFALARIARRPRALARLYPLAVAIAVSYAGLADRAGGRVLGTRFPLHDVALVSASAQLASGLVALGMSLDLVARLLAFVAGERRASGAWGDGKGPDDVMTTLAAASLLARLDPGFDPAPTAAYFAKQQRPDGWFRALGPEAPWLTAEIRAWLVDASRPFSDRFEWPYVPDFNLDHKTRVPFFAAFSELARFFGALEGLAAARVDLAFLDLAGFRAFNNAYGQEMGDAVLAAFAAELAKTPSARTIRDGGDEFLVVGAPTRGGLEGDLDAFRRAWPRAFRARFGADAPPVAPRILVTETRGGNLSSVREMLGRRVGTLKHDAPNPGEEGVLARA